MIFGITYMSKFLYVSTNRNESALDYHEGFVLRRDHESPFFLFKCRLGLTVVSKVSSVVSTKSNDMYILHDSSLVVSLSNISAYFA